MTQNTRSSEPRPSNPEPVSASGTGNWPPDLADLLGRARKLLEEGQPEAALDVMARAKSHSPWAMNALGVCQLRLGNAQGAVEVFRGLALGSGGLVLRADAPTVFKTNYATALIAADNISGGVGVLNEIGDETNPAVQKLRDAVRRWTATLTFWQRLNWRMGGQPARPLVLDFPPGDLG